MSEKEKNTLFHIYRKDGSALFLHPFNNLEKFIELVQKEEFEGRYGMEPRVESLTLFRNDLYRMIEEGVKTWVAEKRFIPRFILSAIVFLLAYLFFSLIVRDPLPVIDEILLSLGVAVLTYFLIYKKDQRSQEALKKRVELRTKVDRIIFTEDPFVKEIEQILHKDEGESTESVLGSILKGLDEADPWVNSPMARVLLNYLEKRFSSKDYKKQEKRIGRLRKGKDIREIKTVTKWAEAKKVDFSLFALYTKIKSVCEKPK